jgi:DNA-binding MarR family transcriptional regulator
MLEKIQQRGATMAFWSKKNGEFEETDQVVQVNPGISQAELARQMGVQRSTIARRLPSMEEAGYLYAEDDKGGLWSFKKKN